MSGHVSGKKERVIVKKKGDRFRRLLLSGGYV